MSKPFRPKGCKIWYIRYYRNGKMKVESSGSEKKTVAQNLLKVREGEIRLGSYIEPANRKVTVDELFGALLANYRYNEAAILEGTEQRWGKRLEKHFGGMRALAVTTEHLNRYITWCREQAGLANATINATWQPFAGPSAWPWRRGNSPIHPGFRGLRRRRRAPDSSNKRNTIISRPTPGNCGCGRFWRWRTPSVAARANC